MNEPNESADRAFEARAQAAFRASVARLDGGRRSRLNQARQLALAEVARPGLRLPRLWLPAGAFATVAALGFAVFLVTPVSLHRHAADTAAVEDVDVLSANDGIDLYAEDPEFIEWAGSGEATASPAPAGADRG